MLSEAKHLIRFFILLACLSPAMPCLSQGKYPIRTYGFVKDGRKQLSGATIRLYSSAKMPDTTLVSADGKFLLWLDLNKIYTIEFSKDGYVSKSVLFNTWNVPEKEMKKYMHEFEFEMELFREIEGLRIKALDKPMASVLFNEKKGYFDFDAEYTEARQLEFYTALLKQARQLVEETRKLEQRRTVLAEEQPGIVREQPVADTGTFRRLGEVIIADARQRADSILAVARLKSQFNVMSALLDTAGRRKEPDAGDRSAAIQILASSIHIGDFPLEETKDIAPLAGDTSLLNRKKEHLAKMRSLLAAQHLRAKSLLDSVLLNERRARLQLEEQKLSAAQSRQTEGGQEGAAARGPAVSWWALLITAGVMLCAGILTGRFFMKK